MTRLATLKDFDFIYTLYMHPEVNPFLVYEKMDQQAFEPIFNDLLHDEVLYVFENAQQRIGMFKFIRLKHRNSHIAYLGGLAIDPPHSGKGYGSSMMQEIIQLAKLRNVLRIELSTDVRNTNAIKLYEKSGFIKEGVMQRYTHLKSENRFVDEVMMAYLGS